MRFRAVASAARPQTATATASWAFRPIVGTLWLRIYLLSALGLIACGGSAGSGGAATSQPSMPVSTAVVVGGLNGTTTLLFDIVGCGSRIAGRMGVALTTAAHPEYSLDILMKDYHGPGKYTDVIGDLDSSHGTLVSLRQALPRSYTYAGVVTKGGLVQVIVNAGEMGGTIDVALHNPHLPLPPQSPGRVKGAWRCPPGGAPQGTNVSDKPPFGTPQRPAPTH